MTAESTKIREVIRQKTADGNSFTEDQVLDTVESIVKDVDFDVKTVEGVVSKHLHYSEKRSTYYFHTRKSSDTDHLEQIRSQRSPDVEEVVEPEKEEEVEPVKEEVLEATNDDSDDVTSEELRQLERELEEETQAEQEESEEEEQYAPNNRYTYPKETSLLRKREDERFGPFGTQWVHEHQEDDVYDATVKRRAEQFDKLKAIILPEQRSKEWFEMRTGKITASDGGCVMGVNKYEAPYKFILKKIDPPEFKSNKFCYHGTKLEEIATMIYEYRMNVKVDEFGLMGHPTIPFLGASPDGIVSRVKLDKKSQTKFVGRMLEIKCPFSRTINKTGEIYGTICPKYYWVQVQQQLECCDLDECDFWQCNIREYATRGEFLKDTDAEEPFRSIETGYEKGCLIQLLPVDQVAKARRSPRDYDEVVFDSSKFLYPPKIEMTPYECDNWIAATISKLHQTEMCNGVAVIDDKNRVTFDPQRYVFDKVVYWKLVDSHNVTIVRDRDWFKNALPIYEKMWKIVSFLRKYPEKKRLFLNYVKSRKRKSNDDIMRVAGEIIDVNSPNYKRNCAKIEEAINQGQENDSPTSQYDSYAFV